MARIVNPYERLGKPELLAALAARDAALEARGAELASCLGQLAKSNERIAALEKQVSELRAAQGKSAAPFAKSQPKANPKRPGRRKGQGRTGNRPAPAPETVTETIPAPLPAAPTCAGCGHALDAQPNWIEQASRTDMAPPPPPRVTVFEVECRECPRCRKVTRGGHPDLAPNQQGASAHRLGATIHAAHAILHYGLGLTGRIASAVLELLGGLSPSQANALSKARKMAGGKGSVGREAARIREQVAQAGTVHTDDTGWRINRRRAHLMVFSAPQADGGPAVYYQIRLHHRHEEVQEVIAAVYQGVLVTDRGPSYDHASMKGVKRQICLAHLLRNMSEKKEEWGECAGTRHLEAGKEILRRAIELHKKEGAGTAGCEAMGKEWENWLGKAGRSKDRRLNRWLEGVKAHEKEGSVTRFLRETGVPATNNEAERSLRPAVIARKVSQCSKSEPGADTYAAMKTVIETTRRRLKQAGQNLQGVLEKMTELFNIRPAPA